MEIKFERKERSYLASIHFLNVSMLAGVEAVTSIVAGLVIIVRFGFAVVLLMMIKELVALEVVLVMDVVASFVAVAAGISAELLLLVRFCSALVVRISVVDVVEREAGFEILLVDLFALPFANVRRSNVGLDGKNESDKNFHCVLFSV